MTEKHQIPNKNTLNLNGTVIEVADLRKKYGSLSAVDGIVFSVNPGETYGLLGPNGAGKTTSFYMIVGLVPNDSGQITLNNEDLTLLPMHERARRGIGYLPQEASIFRKLTVYENIMAILQTRKELTDVERERLKDLSILLVDDSSIARKQLSDALDGINISYQIV